MQINEEEIQATNLKTACLFVCSYPLYICIVTVV